MGGQAEKGMSAEPKKPLQFSSALPSLPPHHLRRHDVERRRDELHLNRHFFRRHGLCGAMQWGGRQLKGSQWRRRQTVGGARVNFLSRAPPARRGCPRTRSTSPEEGAGEEQAGGGCELRGPISLPAPSPTHPPRAAASRLTRPPTRRCCCCEQAASRPRRPLSCCCCGACESSSGSGS